jgi:hypothetical protein
VEGKYGEEFGFPPYGSPAEQGTKEWNVERNFLSMPTTFNLSYLERDLTLNILLYFPFIS